MRENLDYRRGLLDGGDDPELPATLRAGLEIDIEYALEQARPTHARSSVRMLMSRIAGFLDRTRFALQSHPD